MAELRTSNDQLSHDIDECKLEFEFLQGYEALPEHEAHVLQLPEEAHLEEARHRLRAASKLRSCQLGRQMYSCENTRKTM